MKFNFNMDYLYALQQIRESAPEFVNWIFLFVSEVFLISGPIVSGIIYWSFSKPDGAAIFLGYVGANFVNQTIKNIVCVYRPWILDSRLHIDKIASGSATGYSFPSGHTTTAASVFGGIAVYKRDKKWIVALMSLFIILVAFSRNWLGAHTLKDVVVAVLHTCVCLCIVNVLRCFLEKNKQTKLDSWISVVVILVSAAILVFLSVKPYPLDYSDDGTLLVDPFKMLTDCYTATGMIIGGVLGWWLERHFVRFETDGIGKKRKFFRSLFGVICFVVLFLVLSPLLKFLGTHWQHFAKYFILAFFSIFVYPLIFSAIENRFDARKISG